MGSYLDEMRNDGAPDVRMLWNRTAHARKLYTCDRCGEPIQAGEKYESLGLIEDGDFRHERKHLGADAISSLSGCPAERSRQLAELEDMRDQFERDRQHYFPEG